MSWEFIAALSIAAVGLLWGAAAWRRATRFSENAAYSALLRKAQRLGGPDAAVDLMVRQFRRSRRLSGLQIATLEDIIHQGEQRRQNSAFLGEIGEQITVEGEVMSIEYADDATIRSARHVVAAGPASVIYTGPVQLGHVHDVVRFDATVIQHRVNDLGPWDTVVDNVRDVIVVEQQVDK